MLDNQLFQLIFAQLNAGLASQGQGSITCVQNYQPEQQGVPSGPTLFVYKSGGDQRLGSPGRSAVQGAGACAFTGSTYGGVLTVSAVASGAMEINQLIAGAGIPANIIITSFGTGVGGVGTYNLNYPPGTVASEAMTSIGAWVYTESEVVASTFQCSGLATQNPANIESLTASDIANLAAYVLQSAATIAAFEAQGVGVLRIPSVRNPYFTDDRQRYEASPSFDFTITHRQTIITTVPTVTETEFHVDRV